MVRCPHGARMSTGSLVGPLVGVLAIVGSANLATAVAYAQRIGYPAFGLAGLGPSSPYWGLHMKRIGAIVLPGFALGVPATVALPFVAPSAWAWAACAGLAAFLATTLGTVLAHGRLAEEADEVSLRSVLRWNGSRLVVSVAWVVACAAATIVSA